MNFRRLLAAPALTRQRIWIAYTVAISTDLLQLALGPFGFAFADEALDLIAVAVTEAQRKAQAIQQEQMQSIAGGLPLPFKLPF